MSRQQDSNSASGVRVVGIALVLTALAFTHMETLESLWDTWNVDAYGHGGLVALVSIWLLWRERVFLYSSAARSSIVGALVTAMLLSVWLVADLAQVAFLAQVCLFLGIASSIWATHGFAIARRLAFPVLLPLVSVSAWGFLLGFLVDATSALVGLGIPLLGMPAFVDGSYIYIPAGAFVIADVCGGLRYLLAGLTIALLYAYLYLQGVWSRILLVGAMCLWVILLNAVRVIIVIVIGHLFGMEHPLVEDHGTTGWLLFALGLVPMMLLGMWLERLEGRGAAHVAVSKGPAGLVGGAQGAVESRRRVGWVTGAIVLLILTFEGFEVLIERNRLALHEIDIAGATVCAPSDDARTWHPQYKGATREHCWAIGSGAQTVDFYAAQYASETRTGKLIYYVNQIYAASDGRLVGTDRVISSGVPVAETVLRSPDGSSRLIWHFYVVGSHVTVSDVAAKLLRLRSVVERNRGGSVFALSVSAMPGELDAARSRLSEAMQLVRFDDRFVSDI